MSQTTTWRIPEGPAPPDVPDVETVAQGVPEELEACEIVDGQVVLTMSTTDPHRHVVVELGCDLTLWARAHGALVASQTFAVQTTRTRRREPDLLVVLAEHRDRVTHDGMDGPPDIAVEVLSASTRRIDLVDKRAEYAELGVAEYWVVDLDAGEVRCAAPPDAPWRTLRRGDVLTSAVLPGFEVPLDRILPPPE